MVLCHRCGQRPAKIPLNRIIDGRQVYMALCEVCYNEIMQETSSSASKLDKFGRDIGLGFPAGAKIEEMARRGKYIVLPYTVKGMDVSFSGILTKIQNLYKKGASPEDLCFSFQETAFAMMAEVAERAMAHVDKQELLLVGGVAANKKFCEMLQIMCEERGAKFFKCPMQYCGDQGAMIAWEGLIRFKEKRFITEINPYWRVDEV